MPQSGAFSMSFPSTVAPTPALMPPLRTVLSRTVASLPAYISPRMVLSCATASLPM